MGERDLSVRRHVAASADSVWSVVADFPNLAEHAPSGLKASRVIGDATSGVGACRRLDLKPVGALVETVTEWEEGRMLATANEPSALVPFNRAEGRITIEPDGDGAAITFDYRYVPRGGPVGRVIGPLIDRMLTSNFTSMLADIEAAALDES